jgi:hypothetical protein
MGLMDKVKPLANQAAQKAQEAGKAGQAKLEAAQARRRADGMLRDLGWAVFAQKTGRATESTDADISRLTAELQSFESEYGPIAS